MLRTTTTLSLTGMVLLASGALAEAGAPRYGERFALRSDHGTYVVAETDGNLNANRGAIGGWETFRIQDASGGEPSREIHYNDIVSFRSDHGLYMIAESDGRANANRSAVGEWERFRLLDARQTSSSASVRCGDRVALLSHHGRYLVAEGDGRANANRTAIGGWEQFELVCLDRPEQERLTVLDGGGLTLDVSGADAVLDGHGELLIRGDMTMERGGRRIQLLDADLRAVLRNGALHTLRGTARVPMPAMPGPLAGMDTSAPVWAEIGLAYGRDLAHLQAPLQPHLKYAYADLRAGLEMGTSISKISFYAGSTMVMDPADPFLFARGEQKGFMLKNPLEKVGIGVSAHGQARLAAERTWGLEDLPGHLDGHLYLTGRVSVPTKLPVISIDLDGELVTDIDPRRDGFDPFRVDNDQLSLGNGSIQLELGFLGLVAAEIPLADGTVRSEAVDGRGVVHYSGAMELSTPEHRESLQHGLRKLAPIEMLGAVRIAGKVTPARSEGWTQLAGTLDVAGHRLTQGLVRVEESSVRVSGDLDLVHASVGVSGQVSNAGMSLQGRGQVSVPMVAPKTLVRDVTRAVRFVEDAAVCGYTEVTDSAICGVESFQCGTRTVACGVESIWCGIFQCSQTRYCDQAQWCTRARTCQGPPASCWRDIVVQESYEVPEFEWGRFEVDLDVTLVPHGITGRGRTRFCPVGGDCYELPSGSISVNGGRLQVCGEVSGLGYRCAVL